MELDLERLAAQIGLEREDVAELLDVFFATAPPAAENLEQALREGDYPVAVRAAHTIRGSSATVGLDEVAGVAGELERRLRALAEGGEDNADNDGLDSRVQALHNCLARVRAAYEEISP